ncbi:hypothetical protein HER10_EVM0012867 [Colletotrichum scovillei]|uniref:uncharacterized protein n=1 Tax=Colletotrichum scovillei TaxID=1209932 RepID=UPI0015C32818|nr:uncharacterized protein HER10_EVM0012867 [Colletotrichum scovillei]KAF4773384.1 hypothetical protein HER10_EVM0012867 [Colletotrichum scovillei]
MKDFFATCGDLDNCFLLGDFNAHHKCPDVVTKMCPFRTGEHTVGHLFYACPDLQEERSQLPLKDFRGGKRTRNGMCTLEGLLTEGAAQASRWAINHFGIQQFTWTLNHADFASFKDMVYAHQGGF